ncbi:MAG: hypothetical protein ABW047_02195 [Nitrospiraceae bacterium]|jgi:hypothetical protein
MTQVFHSGAFIQQCVAVHPLCISLKRFEEQNKLVFTCSSCRMAHHIIVDSIVARTSIAMDSPDLPAPPSLETDAGVLTTCINEHTGAVTIRGLDVIQDRLGLRCATCRRVFDLHAVTFETRQK